MTDEEVVKYDPKVWNEYSKVKPPKKGYFRVELRNDSGEVELRSVEYWDKTFEACYISPKPLNLFFKPWDDDGCFQNGNDHLVWLTVEEAKEIIGTYIGTNCEIVKQHGIPELRIKNPSWLIQLLERIEQAEVAKICADYNKALNRVAEEFQKQAEGQS